MVNKTVLASASGELPEEFARQIAHEGDCWIWTAQYAGSRYGVFRGMAAHRFAYSCLVGPIPDDRELDHRCRRTFCVNPEHLEPVSHQENMRRGIRAQKSHCKRGHALTPENLYPGYRRRFCKLCHRERERARRS